MNLNLIYLKIKNFQLYSFVSTYILVDLSVSVKLCRNVKLSSPLSLSTALSPLAHNVRAAWRRRGVRYSSCGLQTFIFPLHFPRRYTPACAKPPVVRCHFNLGYFHFL